VPSVDRNWRFFLLAAVSLLTFAAVLLAPPMAQPLSYHDFADCRVWWSIPNTLNVLTNLPFLWFGVQGLRVIWQGRLIWRDPREALPYLIFFLGAALTCLGSMYYHWQPDNPRLVWDRLPMTLAFAGLIAAVLGERLSLQWGQRALWPLLIAGAVTVFYWYGTERLGRGNVMPYGINQGWAILIVLLLLLLFPAHRYTRGAELWWPILLYALAKVFETFDLWIYRATGTLASGHSIKHLLAAGAVWALMRTLLRRAPIASVHQASARAVTAAVT
jgi:hypothetical protein